MFVCSSIEAGVSFLPMALDQAAVTLYLKQVTCNQNQCSTSEFFSGWKGEPGAGFLLGFTVTAFGGTPHVRSVGTSKAPAGPRTRPGAGTRCPGPGPTGHWRAPDSPDPGEICFCWRPRPYGPFAHRPHPEISSEAQKPGQKTETPPFSIPESAPKAPKPSGWFDRVSPV